MSADTVALVVDDQDGDTVPFCSGVWVADDKILTAGHCAAAVVPDGEGDAGTPVQYIVQAEVVGQWQNPTTRHEARVLRIDRAHDLALLYAPNSPSHAVARLADADPRPGDELHFIGQDRGFYWTYMRGWMSGRLARVKVEDDYRPGPWYQVTAPVSHGMSGSGAFDDGGRLVGICSAVAPAPSVAIYSSLELVRAFLTAK